MTDNGTAQKPSETAFFAAFHRAIANREYGKDSLGPDHLAEKFLPPHFQFFLKFKWVRARSRARLEEAFPGLHAYVTARTLFFDEVFQRVLENNISQVVLLGAGYDTRAYRFAELNQGTKIIELDSAPTQNQKLQFLKKARILIPDNVSHVPIDFNLESIGDVLWQAGYDNEAETLFLWEGVSYYLEAASVEETMDLVSQSRHPWSTLAFDYTIPLNKDTSNVHGMKAFYQSMKERHSDERLMFAISDGEIVSFLGVRGLRVIKSLDNETLQQDYLISVNGLQMGQVTGNFRIALAVPMM